MSTHTDLPAGHALVECLQTAVPLPPPGIANCVLRCGHIAQMKRGHAHLRKGGFTWCEACQETRAIVEVVT